MAKKCSFKTWQLCPAFFVLNPNEEPGTEKKLDEAHFDSEQFQTGQNRLIEIRQNIVTQILMRNFDLARRETGRLFHTLQDFYSHSNWIENGNRVPYDVLGRLNERPGIVADNDRPTCTDCEEGEIRDLNFFRALESWLFDVPSSMPRMLAISACV